MFRRLFVCFFAILAALLLQTLADQNSKPSFTNSLIPGTSSGDLVGAIVFHRHGDRTPVMTYPLDPWSDPKVWPIGYGQLTNEGKRQLYELGTWLRLRYKGTAVLHEHYHPDDVYYRSTDTDRTLMSASVLASALYPTVTEADRWLNSGDSSAPVAVGSVWQPIPIHSMPTHLDDVLYMGRSCAYYDYLHAEQERKDLRHYNAHYPHLMAFLSNHTGFVINNTLFLTVVYDTLALEAAHNLTMPAWSRRIYPHSDALRHMAQRSFTRDTRTEPLVRLKFGRIIGEILQRFRERATGRLVPVRRSLWLNSAHDSTLACILDVLGLHKLHFPPYAAALIFELYRNADGVFHVQILYRNSTTTEPHPLHIPNCGTHCPLNRMHELYGAVITAKSWEEECQWPKMRMQKSSGSVVALGRSLCFVWCLLYGVIWYGRHI